MLIFLSIRILLHVNVFHFMRFIYQVIKTRKREEKQTEKKDTNNFIVRDLSSVNGGGRRNVDCFAPRVKLGPNDTVLSTLM